MDLTWGGVWTDMGRGVDCHGGGVWTDMGEGCGSNYIYCFRQTSLHVVCFPNL